MGLSEKEQRVCDLIRKREGALLEDLRLHVGLPTGGRNVAALDETRERLVARAVAMGAKVEMVPGVARPEWLYGEKPGQTPLPTAVCRRNGVSGSGKEVLIAGHLDTVHDPAGAFRELTIAADGKTAVGPGCVDMKGGLVIAIEALEALEEAGVRTNWTVMLNSDEETGSYHSAPAITEEAKRVAKASGLGVALEPATADGGLVIERFGSAQFMIEVRGKSAHVGRDFASGASAVMALVNILASPLTEMSENFIVNIGPLQGGTTTNVVPDLARAWGNLRFTGNEQAAVFARNFEHVFREPYMGTTSVLKMSVGRPAKPETPEIRSFANLVCAASADLGRSLPLSQTGGVCDGNLMQAAGLPTLDTLGVRGGGLHTPQEWIDLSSLVERCQLLAVVLMRASVDR
jgi:glutamate carboxypeptidase